MESKYVNSVSRAIDILYCFDYETPSLKLSNISDKVQLSTSTVHRLLSTLEKKQMVIHDQQTQEYCLGPKLLLLSEVFLENMEIRKIALPELRKLNKETNETVELNIVEGGERVCIEQLPSTEVIRNFVRVGSRNSLFESSSGKSLLANMEYEEINKIIETEIGLFPHITEHKLKQDLDDIKSQGYAVSIEERIPGAFSVSAPLKNHKGKLIAGITVAGPMQRYNEANLSNIIKYLLVSSQEISCKLGYKSD
ncbi:IclR family transcriptional regulator [Salicibibacter cibarius]|uniref:IclR family transcriptional regulator n=1 Tax=Salicibibacter cibarius TaxID=2743000 RepID=A0A7T7CDA7_9BACI|nr:IclR family transcriptional regulator [Salicibibacter cibarius]QQK77819.1 IclR family transcriptional regulator [Salicibibacter cibarius]